VIVPEVDVTVAVPVAELAEEIEYVRIPGLAIGITIEVLASGVANGVGQDGGGVIAIGKRAACQARERPRRLIARSIGGQREVRRVYNCVIGEPPQHEVAGSDCDVSTEDGGEIGDGGALEGAVIDGAVEDDGRWRKRLRLEALIGPDEEAYQQSGNAAVAR